MATTTAKDPDSSLAADRLRAARRQWRVTILMAIVILIPSMYGFVGKFVELVRLFREPENMAGAFAIAPITNYLLASLGFLCMLVWASRNGMFRDVESPKEMMLAHEFQLDHAASRTTNPNPATPRASS